MSESTLFLFVCLLLRELVFIGILGLGEKFTQKESRVKFEMISRDYDEINVLRG